MKNTNKNKNTTKLPSSLRTAFIRFACKHAKLNHSVAAPLPTKSNDFAGTPNKVKKGFRFYCAVVMALAFTLGCSMTAFAAGDPITVVNNLSDFIFGLIRAVGLILLGWGIVQVGLSFQSHDPSQRSNGFLTLAVGIVITFAKEILTLITG